MPTKRKKDLAAKAQREIREYKNERAGNLLKAIEDVV